MDFSLETLDRDLLHESEALLKAHWEEIAIYKDKITLDPNYDSYIQLQRANKLIVVTARDNGVLVGYCSFIIGPGGHYKKTRYAENDMLFLSEEYRKGINAVRMIKFTEKMLKRVGVHVMLLNMKASHPSHSLCKALRMDPSEISYSKYIGN